MERRKQSLLFEQESLTPGKRAEALRALFHAAAHRERSEPHTGYVPVEVLAAHGDLDSHLRHLVTVAFATTRKDPVRQRLLRRIEKRLNTLPESIMQTLPANTEQDWMRCYRDLVELHEWLDDAQLVEDAQEYSTIIAKMLRVAETVSEASAVRIGAGSVFALWLQRVYLDRYSPRKRRAPRAKKKKATAARRKTSTRNHAKTTRKTEQSTTGL